MQNQKTFFQTGQLEVPAMLGISLNDQKSLFQTYIRDVVAQELFTLDYDELITDDQRNSVNTAIEARQFIHPSDMLIDLTRNLSMMGIQVKDLRLTTHYEPSSDIFVVLKESDLSPFPVSRSYIGTEGLHTGLTSGPLLFPKTGIVPDAGIASTTIGVVGTLIAKVDVRIAAAATITTATTTLTGEIRIRTAPKVTHVAAVTTLADTEVV